MPAQDRIGTAFPCYPHEQAGLEGRRPGALCTLPKKYKQSSDVVGSPHTWAAMQAVLVAGTCCFPSLDLSFPICLNCF